MKKNLSYILALSATALMGAGCLASCGGGGGGDDTRVADIIAQAEKMDKAELYQKAMEEINGKNFVVVANSSRMKDAAPAWKTYCQKTFNKPEFEFNFSSTQPKNNQIFSQIKSDVTGNTHNISMTLIQDGSQIKSKMTTPGYLLNYIPKEWAGDKVKDGEPLALQSLSKVFCYNNGGGAEFKNCWDFALRVSTQFMAPSSEPVGQNFLYMLTQEKYANYVKEGYDALGPTYKEYVDDLIAGKQYKFSNGEYLLKEGKKQEDADTGIPTLMEEGGFCTNAKYSLAWIYSFLKSYTRVSDDGPISNNLTTKVNEGAAGLLVYSKFRSIQETEEVSNKVITVAAYQDAFKGFGGYMYKHYLQVLKTSPYPWTSCALINFMVTEKDGFQPWGKDIGGYSSNPTVQAQFDHSNDGGTEIPVKNDKGYDWWVNSGKLVLEDGEYASSVAPTLSEWIAYL